MTSQSAAREHRIGMYSDWVSHDVDGLVFNPKHPSELPRSDEYQLLVAAKLKISEASQKIEAAIIANRLANRSAA